MSEHDCPYCDESAAELIRRWNGNNFDGYMVPRPDTIHQGELKCKWCGRFIGWIPKDPAEKKRWRTPEIDASGCQMCRTLKGDLGDHESLHHHHVDGNPKNNDPFNLWVLCTGCHGIVHHQITYHAHYVKKINRIKDILS